MAVAKESLELQLARSKQATEAFQRQLEARQVQEDAMAAEEANDVKIASMVLAAVAKIPMPKDGEQGPQGVQGKTGKPGKQGPKGKSGADGVGIDNIYTEGTSLKIALTDKTTKILRMPVTSGGGAAIAPVHEVQSASRTPFDGTIEGVPADNVQGALDYIISNGTGRNVSSIVGSGTAEITTYMNFVDSSAGNSVITIPTAIGNEGAVINIKRIDSSGFTCTVAGTENIDGDASLNIDNYDNVKLISNNVQWYIV